MAFDADNLTELPEFQEARIVASKLRNFKRVLTASLSLVNADQYTAVLDKVGEIKKFRNYVQGIIDAGRAAAVRQIIADSFQNQNVTNQALNQFVVALVDIADYLIANAGAFPMSYTAEYNRVFVESPGPAIKAELINKINTALSHVSGA